MLFIDGHSVILIKLYCIAIYNYGKQNKMFLHENSFLQLRSPELYAVLSNFW